MQNKSLKNMLKSHTAYYLSFGALLLVCFGIVVATANQPQSQAIAIMLTAVLYVVWGVAHHFVHHDISAKIVVEYVLIGALGIALALLISR